MDEVDSSKKNLGYSLLYSVTYLFSLLPFSVLYLFSDILYCITYYIVRYRRKIVRKNLNNSFPEKSEKKIIEIEKEFYRHLCDCYFEAVKLLSISEEEMKRRMKFENPEIIERLTSDGNSCILGLGHYGNWEWVSSIILHLDSRVKLGFLYKELHSKAFDQLFLKMRSGFGGVPIEKLSAFRRMVKFKQEKQTMLVGFLSDQRPPKRVNQYWTKFLNQDTNVQNGMERIAKHLSCSIVYLDIKKVKRGYYVAKIFVITPDASDEPDNLIMERYIRKLEESVIRDPALYLWSHNRWKFNKPSNLNDNNQN